MSRILNRLGSACACIPLPVLLLAAALPFGAERGGAAPPAPLILQVAGKSVRLALPDGACVYDRSQPMDAKILAFLEKENAGAGQLLLAFADCDDLAAIRQGKPAFSGYYGQIVSDYSLQGEARRLSRTGYVAERALQYNAAAAEQSKITSQQRVQAILSEPMMAGDTRILGVVRSDPEFLQMGMTQNMGSQGETLRKTDGIVTFTKLGAPVSINLYHAETGPSSWDSLEKKSVAYVRLLLTLNPEEGLPPAPPPSGGDKRIVAVAGLVFVSVAGSLGLVARKRRRAA